MVAHPVAPHRGAWIETTSCTPSHSLQVSPLTEGRGLKHFLRKWSTIQRSSPLTEGRGLKHGLRAERAFEIVSPLTEGRGLKHGGFLLLHAGASSPLTEGRGLKLHAGASPSPSRLVAPHRGAWIETFPCISSRRAPLSPLTEGRGLKLSFHFTSAAPASSPLTEGRGLKPATLRAKLKITCRPSQRGVD